MVESEVCRWLQLKQCRCAEKHRVCKREVDKGGCYEKQGSKDRDPHGTERVTLSEGEKGD